MKGDEALNEANSQTDFLIQDHLLEMDADEFSGITMASHIIQYWQKLGNQDQNHENLKKLIILACSSLILYILSFPSNRRPLYFKESTHPHPVIRVSSVCSTLSSHCKQVLTQKGIDNHLVSKEIIDESLKVAKCIEEDRWGSSLCILFRKNLEESPLEIAQYIDELFHLRYKNPMMAVTKRNNYVKSKNNFLKQRV